MAALNSSGGAMTSLNSSGGAMTSPSSSRDPSCVAVTAAFYATRLLLLLPLCVLVLRHAARRWRRRRSFDAASHADVFTFHVVAMETAWVLGMVLHSCGAALGAAAAAAAGYFLLSTSYLGQSCFHLLTCAERYLAVVHPLTYRGLRRARGARLRNGAAGGAWALCLALSGVLVAAPGLAAAFLLGLAACSLAGVAFGSACALRVLVRSGPGDGGGDGERGDRSKRRAFRAIAATSAAILLWFLPFLAATALRHLVLPAGRARCLLDASGDWFNLPSSLVAPLLYLHRNRKQARRRERAGP